MAYGAADLIGRQEEQAALDHALASAREGAGGIVLLAGEAGMGKTRLAEACLTRSGHLVLAGEASEVATPPYGPIIAALRAFLRTRPGGLETCGPLGAYLALLLPELGPPPGDADRATLVEAIRCAFTTIARAAPAAVFLDDLQWSDRATLELLPGLAATCTQERLLIVGAYRSDEIPRGHPVRRLRNDLRRGRLLREIPVEPLDQEAATALAARILGEPPSAHLAAALYERTEGVPLFVEELGGALTVRGRLRRGAGGLEQAPGVGLPIPETLRDAVLLRLEGLPDHARRLIELAAVVGRDFDQGLVAELAGGEEGLDDLFARGLLVEGERAQASFRHALTREAVYEEISRARRRTLHRQVAERLEATGTAPQMVAEHWLAASDSERARAALIAAARTSCDVHAYRDAADAAQRALELWPEAVDEAERLEVLDQLGHCAQVSGMLAEAARAWSEVAEGWRRRSDESAHAEAERNLAGVAELLGQWERALAAREAAARAFAAGGQPAEAAAERLAAAAHLRSAARYHAALDLLALALEDSRRAARPDLEARIIAHEGSARARLGETTVGLELVRAGLALALEHGLPGAAAEIYQRLADALEHAGDYAGAKATYLTAFDFCQAHSAADIAQICLACLTVVLRHTGEWERAMSLCREVLASADSAAHARAVASSMLGSLHALRGQPRRAQPLLLEAAALAGRIELAAVELYAAWGLALVAELDSYTQTAAAHCRAILARWEQTEERHHVVTALRWAARCFVRAGARADTQACANALARIASATGQPEALSALAQTLGEIALLDANADQAVQLFRQAIDLLRDIEAPYCRATAQFRAGIACAAANQRSAAVEHLSAAYRAARRLGARPLAGEIAQALEALGEPLAERLGDVAAGRLRHGDLTRRQLEILQLVAQGRTNPEIARELFLSPRTVEMHVGNILAALDSRSRAQAVRRAAELGLLGS